MFNLLKKFSYAISSFPYIHTSIPLSLKNCFAIFSFSSADIKRCFRVCPSFKSFYLHTSLPTSVKKSLCIIVMISLLFSGILPKNQEIKNNLIVALNCAVNTIEVNFYDKYSSIVISAINYVLNGFSIKMVAKTQLIAKEQKEETNNNTVPPVNTSADNAIIQNNITNQADNILKTKLTYLVYQTTNKLYNKYNTIKLNCNRTDVNIGILFFILFSILVVRIKDTIAVINNNRIIGKNRLGFV